MAETKRNDLMPFPTPIAIAVVESEGRFLVGQRPEGVPLAGLWEFPGGKIEMDETPEDTAIRECNEEAGIEVAIAATYPEHVQQYDHDRVRLYFFSCRPINPNAIPREPFRWVMRDQLRFLEFPIGNRGLLKQLLGET